MTGYKVLPHAQPADVGLCPECMQRLMDVLQREVTRERLPGAVAMIAQRGHIALFEAAGKQHPGTGTPMKTDSIFRIYSMTKPVVSVAAMMLVERGLLLSDPVSHWLPEYAHQQVSTPHGLEPAHNPATVQDLLRHTAGLTYEFLNDSPVQREYTQVKIVSRDRTNEDFSRTLASVPLQFQPGSVWAYSRATDVLGRLVEVVSGQGLGSFLQSEIFGPLGMVDTGFSVSQAHRRTVCARPRRRRTHEDARPSPGTRHGRRRRGPDVHHHGLRPFFAVPAQPRRIERRSTAWSSHGGLHDCRPSG